MLSPIFEKFVEKSPISVMARGMIERVLNPSQLDQWFNETAEQQYTKDLMFSTVFDVMSQVVCGSRNSVHAAYQASTEDIGVSITSVYNKLNGIETNTSAELVRYAAKQVEPIIIKLGGTTRSPLPGLRIKLLDGNCIEKSQHRIEELRSISAGPLPGKSLVVYESGIAAERIAYLTGELIDDHHSLVRLLMEILNEMPRTGILYLLLDEVTYIRKWGKGIKFLADAGMLENIVVFLTGSDMVIIKEARMRLPGRRGTADVVDFHLFPLNFLETVRLKKRFSVGEMDQLSSSQTGYTIPLIDKLFEEFNFYLVHGGFLTANKYLS